MSQKEAKADDELMRALELELAEKRVRWQENRERYRTLRILSFSFLSIVIIGGLVAFFFSLTRGQDARARHSATTPTPLLSAH